MKKKKSFAPTTYPLHERFEASVIEVSFRLDTTNTYNPVNQWVFACSLKRFKILLLNDAFYMLIEFSKKKEGSLSILLIENKELN